MIFATRGGQGVQTVADGLAKWGKIAHARCVAALRDQRGFFGGSPGSPPPPPPPPLPDNTEAQAAAAKARAALQRRRGQRATILAGAGDPRGLTVNPGGTPTLG
jgi:hypothetical protein